MSMFPIHPCDPGNIESVGVSDFTPGTESEVMP